MIAVVASVAKQRLIRIVHTAAYLLHKNGFIHPGRAFVSAKIIARHREHKSMAFLLDNVSK